MTRAVRSTLAIAPFRWWVSSPTQFLLSHAIKQRLSRHRIEQAHRKDGKSYAKACQECVGKHLADHQQQAGLPGLCAQYTLLCMRDIENMLETRTHSRRILYTLPKKDTRHHLTRPSFQQDRFSKKGITTYSLLEQTDGLSVAPDLFEGHFCCR